MLSVGFKPFKNGIYTTDAERNVILKIKSDGLSHGKVAQIMKCSKHKLCNVHYTRSIETGGRKRKSSKRYDQILVLYSKKNAFKSSNGL